MIVTAFVVLALSASDGPLVYDVPAGHASLEAQRPPLFFAAPFTVRNGRVVRGAWRSSDEVLGPDPTRVVIVASWCPACHQLLEWLSSHPPQSTVILFVEDESDRRGKGREQLLSNPSTLERYALTFHVLRAGSALARRVTAFPTMLVCSRDRCTPEARRDR